MPSEPIRFVTAIWVKEQWSVRIFVFQAVDLATPPRFHSETWLTDITPSLGHDTVKNIIAGTVHVAAPAIALVEVADA